jgi:hypothetical protein
MPTLEVSAQRPRARRHIVVRIRRWLCCSRGGLIKCIQIFTDWPGDFLRIWPRREFALSFAPKAGTRLNHAGVDGKAFAADQASLHAQVNDLLKELAEQVALTETAVTVF